MSDITKEQNEKEFRRHCGLCKGLGLALMRRILEEVMAKRGRFSMKAWYKGEMDPDLDTRIKDAAKPGVWWAQGYDLVRCERDIAFDYKSELERSAAIKRVVAVIDDATVMAESR